MKFWACLPEADLGVIELKTERLYEIHVGLWCLWGWEEQQTEDKRKDFSDCGLELLKERCSEDGAWRSCILTERERERESCSEWMGGREECLLASCSCVAIICKTTTFYSEWVIGKRCHAATFLYTPQLFCIT